MRPTIRNGKFEITFSVFGMPEKWKTGTSATQEQSRIKGEAIRLCLIYEIVWEGKN